MTADLAPTMGINPADMQTLSQAAAAAASFLPSPVPLDPQSPALGSIAQTSGFAAAAVCDLQGPRTGRMALLVGSQLVDALSNADGGPVEVHQALQPALDAAAASLGLSASASRAGNPETAGAALGVGWLIVPLSSQHGLGALLISASAVLTQQQEPAVSQFQNENPSPAEAAPGVVRLPDAAQIPQQPGATATVAMPVPATTPGAGTGAWGAQDGQPVAPTFGYETPGQFTPAEPLPTASASEIPTTRGLEFLHGVTMDVTVELGRTQMTVKQLLSMKPGATIELDRAAGAPADLLVNGRIIAKGEVVVIDEDYGLRITDVVDNPAQIG